MQVLNPQKYYIVTFALFSNGEVRYEGSYNVPVSLLILVHETVLFAFQHREL